MKLLSYVHDNKPSWGRIDHNGKIVDMSLLYRDLREALEDRGLTERLAAADGPTHAVDQVTLLPVIPSPSKIICIGVNYHSHKDEMQRKDSANPTVFTRFANSQVAHGQPLIRPPESEQFDYEGEIAVIIGKGGRRIPREQAWEHVAGYAPYCDGTLRDWQRHSDAQQWTPGKNFVGTGGFGPWMVTRDEIPDGADLTLKTRVNGQEVQSSRTGLLIFDIPSIISYCSTFTELEPGDVIATGTPGGIGAKRTPPLWLKAGDVVEVEVEKVGTLRHPVIAEAI